MTSTATDTPAERLAELRADGVTRLTRAQLAHVLGIKANSIDRSRGRGRMIEPDGFMGRTPWWSARSVERLIAAREQPWTRDRGKST